MNAHDRVENAARERFGARVEVQRAAHYPRGWAYLLTWRDGRGTQVQVDLGPNGRTAIARIRDETDRETRRFAAVVALLEGDNA